MACAGKKKGVPILRFCYFWPAPLRVSLCRAVPRLGLIILWSLVRVQHGLPKSFCFHSCWAWPISVQCRVLEASVAGFHEHFVRHASAALRRHLSDDAPLVHDEVRARLACQPTKAGQFVTRLWGSDSKGKVRSAIPGNNT